MTQALRLLMSMASGQDVSAGIAVAVFTGATGDPSPTPSSTGAGAVVRPDTAAGSVESVAVFTVCTAVSVLLAPAVKGADATNTAAHISAKIRVNLVVK